MTISVGIVYGDQEGPKSWIHSEILEIRRGIGDAETGSADLNLVYSVASSEADQDAGMPRVGAFDRRRRRIQVIVPIQSSLVEGVDGKTVVRALTARAVVLAERTLSRKGIQFTAIDALERLGPDAQALLSEETGRTEPLESDLGALVLHVNPIDLADCARLEDAIRESAGEAYAVTGHEFGDSVCTVFVDCPRPTAVHFDRILAIARQAAGPGRNVAIDADVGDVDPKPN